MNVRGTDNNEVLIPKRCKLNISENFHLLHVSLDFTK